MIAEAAPTVMKLAFGGLAGAAAGWAYFSALRWNVDLFERGAAPKAILLLISRFAGLAALLIGMAALGAPVLLSTLLGLLAVRRAVIRRQGGLE